MALFQASLLDGSGNVALDVVGSTIAISDYSNYIASTEAGNEQLEFNYKRIAVTKYGSSDAYIFSTISGEGTLLAYPSTYSTVPYVTNYTFDSDGVYCVDLITIPQLTRDVTYNSSTLVVALGGVYKSKTNSNNTQPTLHTETANWKWLFDFDNPNWDLVTSKYRATEYIAVTCGLQECWANMGYNVNCIELNAGCNDIDLCSNSTWVKFMRLTIILDVIDSMVGRGDYLRADELVNDGISICNCCGQ